MHKRTHQSKKKKTSPANTQALKTMLRDVQAVQDALYHIDALLGSGEVTFDLFGALHKTIARVLAADNICIGIIHKDGKRVTYPYLVNCRLKPSKRQSAHELSLQNFLNTLHGHVVEQKQAILCLSEDLKQLRAASTIESIAFLDETWAQSLIAPLIWQDEIIGVVALQVYAESAGYTEQDKALLSYIGHQLAAALLHQRDASSLQRIDAECKKRLTEQVRELSASNIDLQNQLHEKQHAEVLQKALYEIADLASQPLALKAFYPAVHTIISRLMYAENLYIAVISEDREKVFFPYIRDGYDQDLVDAWRNELPMPYFMNTLTGYVVKRGKTTMLSGADIVRMRDAGEFSVAGSIFDEWLTWLGAPLEQDGEVLGVIVVQSYRKDLSYTQADVELLTFVAQHIATALARRRSARALKKTHEELERRVEKRTHELSLLNKDLGKQIAEREHAERLQAALYKIAELANQALALKEFYAALHKIIRELIYADNFYVALLNEKEGVLQFPYMVDQSGDSSMTRQLHWDENGFIKNPGLTEYVINMRISALLNRTQYEGEGITVVGNVPEYWLGVPLFLDGKVQGVLAVQSYSEDIAFTRRDKALLTFVSQHIAAALQRKNNAEQLARAHKELQLINSDLEARVEQRTAEISAANQALQKTLFEQEKAQRVQAALYQIAEVTASAEDMRELYVAIHQIIAGLMYAENFYIALLDPDGMHVRFPYLIDPYQEDWIESIPISKFERTLSGYLARLGETWLASGEKIKELEARGFFKVMGHTMVDWLGAPLKQGNQVFGVLAVQSYDESIRYKAADKELLTFVSQHVATALSRKRNEQALKKAHDDLERRVELRTQELSLANQCLEQQIKERERSEKLQATLYQIAELSGRPIELHDFYVAIHNIIGKLMYAENFYIALLDNARNTIEFSYVVDQFGNTAEYKPRHFQQTDIDKQQGYTEYILSMQKPLLITIDDPPPDGLDKYVKNICAWLGVPLMLGEKPIGVLAVQSYTPDISFNNRDKELLTFVSQHIATAIQRKHDANLLSSAHRELKIINDGLERRVQERTQALSGANSELQHALHEQEQAQKLQSALYQIAEVTASAEDMDEFYKAIHHIIGSLMYADNFYIAVFDADDQQVYFPYFKDKFLDEYPVKVMSKEMFLTSLTGYVYKKGEAVLLSYVEMQALAKEHDIKIFGKSWMVDWLGVPLKRGSEVLGAIVVQSYDEKYRHKSSDKEVLTFVSQHIATALSRKKAEQALKKAHEELEKRVALRTEELSSANKDLEQQIKERERAEQLQSALYRIAELSHKAIKLRDFYASLQKIINKLIYAENFYIALQDPDSGNLQMTYAIGKYSDLDKGNNVVTIESQKQKEFGGKVLQTGQPLLIGSNKTSTYPKKEICCDMFSWLGVPLTREGQAVGVLAVASYSDDIFFTEKEKELMTFVSQHISTALQHKYDSDLLKSAHLQLKAANDKLEKRVLDRTRELSAANEQLQEMLEQRKQIEKKLAHDACHDALTDLPNRTLFLDRLGNAIKRNLRRNDLGFAVLFLDLDRFKVVNDSLGHLEGDFLLREVSQRLQRCIRPGDTVARLGGDEFCVLVDGTESHEQAMQIAERVLTRLSEPFMLGEQTLYITTSIGITLSSIGYSEPEEVLRDADVAMYQAKSKGKAQYAIFDKHMHEQAINRLRLESDLRLALENAALEVYYQPIVNIKTGEITAFEALARWQHDELGAVSPAEFIPIAEETGLIYRLGLYVLEAAAQQVMRWRGQGVHYKDLAISVNLSPKQISQPALFDNIMHILNKYNVPADAIKFEITESLLIHNFEQSKALLSELHAKNIQIMLDDFGTGYSSLSYLHHFPLSTLKIDRSFIMNMDMGDENKEIVRTIKTLADSLRMTVVAEGIETDAQLKVLSEFGFDFGQGFLFSRPLRALQADELIKNHHNHQPRRAGAK